MRQATGEGSVCDGERSRVFGGKRRVDEHPHAHRDRDDEGPNWDRPACLPQADAESVLAEVTRAALGAIG